MILFLYVPRAFNFDQLSSPPWTSHLRELFMRSVVPSFPTPSPAPPYQSFGARPLHGHAIDNLHKCWPLITTANSSHNLFWPATVCITTHIATDSGSGRPFVYICTYTYGMVKIKNKGIQHPRNGNDDNCNLSSCSGRHVPGLDTDGVNPEEG